MIKKTSTILFAAAVVSFCGIASGYDRLISADTAGTGALRSGNWAEAVDAILTDEAFSDTAFRYFKLGCAHQGAGNDGKAMYYLRFAVKGNNSWSAFALEKIGDIELKNDRIENSISSFRAAFEGSSNQRYRSYLYGKIYRLVTKYEDRIGTLPWLEDFTETPPAGVEPGIPDIMERLIENKSWKEIDSLVSGVLDSSNYGELHCAVASRLVKEPVPDSVFTTRALFRLSRIASSCGDYKSSSDWLLESVGRPDFQSVISEKSYFYHRAELNFRLKNYNKALRWLKKFEKKYGASPETIFMAARCWRNLKKMEPAIQAYEEYVNKYPSGSMTSDIIWYLAWEKERAGRHLEARDLYARMFGAYPKTKRAGEAMFRYALSFARKNQDSMAVTVFDEFFKKYPKSEMVNGAKFWMSKCLAKTGKTEDARVLFLELAGSAPLDYYGMKSRDILLSMGDSTAGTARPNLKRCDSTAMRWIDSMSVEKRRSHPLSAQDSTALKTGLLLARTKMDEHADFLLEPLAIRYEKDFPLLYMLSGVYDQSGDVTRAYSIARRFSWMIPAASRMTMPGEIFHLLYPKGFMDAVKSSTLKNGISPELALAIIRQESLFDPAIVSPVGAIGLMQIMPYTGKEIAEETNAAYSPDSLYVAGYNINFGCYYISKMLKEFNGDLVCAIASYNGGPHNVKGWLENADRTDPDLFAEDIGFAETRGYVRKVLSNYRVYQWILEGGN